jgi:hypothetical protein
MHVDLSWEGHTVLPGCVWGVGVMASVKMPLLRGTLDLLILRALVVGELHGGRVRQPHRTADPGHLLGQVRFTCSRIAPHGGSWLVDLRLGGIQQQSAGQVLSVQRRRTTTGRDSNAGLGSRIASNDTCHQLKLRCGSATLKTATSCTGY